MQKRQAGAEPRHPLYLHRGGVHDLSHPQSYPQLHRALHAGQGIYIFIKFSLIGRTFYCLGGRSELTNYISFVSDMNYIKNVSDLSDLTPPLDSRLPRWIHTF